MRIPAGAPTSGWLRLTQIFPSLQRYKLKRPPLGTIAVIGCVSTICLFASFMFAMPQIYKEYYQKTQAQNRALIKEDRESLAQGLRPWSDPFGRDDKK